jgi:hypothetical protein
MNANIARQHQFIPRINEERAIDIDLVTTPCDGESSKKQLQKVRKFRVLVHPSVVMKFSAFTSSLSLATIRSHPLLLDESMTS